MKSILGLALLLSVFWWINSGYVYPLLLSLGAASVALTIWLTRRVAAIDGKAYPVIMPSLGLPRYLVWLTWQIIKSNLAVAAAIWSPRSAISPTLVELKASQKTDVGRALYANSITMTPGTITLRIEGENLLAHALTKAGADELLAGEMDRRVRALEA
jgi:multicomponent Na+:H+ antiporter subunit E